MQNLQEIIDAILNAIFESKQWRWIEEMYEAQTMPGAGEPLEKSRHSRRAAAKPAAKPQQQRYAKTPPTLNRQPGGPSAVRDHEPPDAAKWRALSATDPVLQAVQQKMIRDRQNELRAQKLYPTYDELLKWVRANWARLVPKYLEEFRLTALEQRADSTLQRYERERRDKEFRSRGEDGKRVLAHAKRLQRGGRHVSYDEAAADLGILT